ncbi:glycosyltransferase family 2 protein [Candidatus Woesearchaeota archaeon]|nr:MAG: glycosyltransferase family 2 protein [Candidatus Woesearchaeota archaeon]
MLQYALWGVSFVTLWLTLVWLNYLVMGREKRYLKKLPKVSFGIPAWNESRTVVRTLDSLLNLDYPAKLKEIIVVNDGSTDDTLDVLKGYVEEHPEVILIDKENGGKASALNAALSRASGDVFAVMDADTTVERGALRKMLPHLADKRIGAVISRIRVDGPRNFLERMQSFEYVMSSMTRFIMNNFGTLAITHGALTLFSSHLLRKVGGFTEDKDNITEDFEIALRLRKNGYDVIMEPDAVSYTRVPRSISAVWVQRLRWSRGYIYNMWKYRSMIFDNRYGLLGTFQLPVNVLAVVLLVANVGILSIDFMDRFFEYIVRSLTIDGYFVNSLFDFPGLKSFVLARNVQVTLPILVSLALGIYLMVYAHRVFKERLRSNIVPTLAYTLAMPYFSTLNWASAIVKEFSRSKRRWR